MKTHSLNSSRSLFRCVAARLAACLLIGAAGSAQSAVLYDLSTASIGANTFTASAAAGGGGGNLSGNLVFTTTGPVTGNSDYFIGKFASQSLVNEGDVLTLSFTASSSGIRADGTGTQTFRFGLFDAGSATTGSGSPAGNSFSSATGYRADYAQISSASNGIRERTSTNANLFATGNSPLVGTQSSSNFQLNPINGTYSGSFTLELLSAGHVQISSNIGSLSQTVIDTSGAFTSFNTFGFFLVDLPGAPASMNFSSLAVTYTPVPEPSALAVSLGGLLIFLCRRSRVHSAGKISGLRAQVICC